MRTARKQKDEDGATAVEFALIVIPVLVILFGMIQYGMYFYSAQTGSSTANTAVRQIAVGNCQTQADLEAFVDDLLGAAATSDATVVRTYTNPDGTTPADPQPSNVGIGGTVKLTITFDTLNMNFPFVPFLNDAEVTREVQARVEDTTEQGGCS